MACRKAAYRAMTEVSEFRQAQQAHEEELAAKLEAKMKQQWTPASLFATCCTAWLAYGVEVLGASGGSTRGCSGGCGLDHPRIVLEFGDGKATATLSHLLDPFLDYFQKLCQQGQAISMNNNNKKYQLVGFLQPHVDSLKACQQFGFHLVKVSPQALTASQRAHQQQLDLIEDQKRAAKRQKLEGTNDTNLLETVLDICYNHSLPHHLDIADIAWMRLASRQMAKYAAKMARTKLQQLRLSYSSYALHDDGSYRAQEFFTTLCVYYMDRCIPLLHCDSAASSAPAAITPPAPLPAAALTPPPPAAVATKAPDLDDAVEASRKNNVIHFVPDATCDRELDASRFRGHRIQVFLEGLSLSSSSPSSSSDDNDNDAPSFSGHNECLKPRKASRGSSSSDNNRTDKGLQIAQFYLLLQPASAGNYHRLFNLTTKLTYEVTKDNSSQQQQQPSSSSSPDRYNLHIRSFQFGFGELLGIYVRRKLPLERQKLQEQQRQRPVTRAEKNYVKALAKEARDAPGNANAFEGLLGW